MMLPTLIKRMITETDKRLLCRFLYNFAWKGQRAVRAFEKRKKAGTSIPAFLFLSLTDRCNLKCQGCWVTPAEPCRQLSLGSVNRIIREQKQMNSHFFGLLGGEPLLYPDLFDLLAEHSDSYFQVLTNGTLLDAATAAAFRRLGNVTPLISLEGDREVSDQRRGGSAVFDRSMLALRQCRSERLIFGTATSVCKSNFEYAVSEEFLQELIAQGVHYHWYYIYRPVGPDPSPELALSAEEILRLRRFIVDVRCKLPIMIIDAYWDHLGRAVCPAVTGISHHIGPAGDIEPCPPIQFAAENINSRTPVAELLRDSQFLEKFRKIGCETTRGCILLEDPHTLLLFLREQQAYDSSGRGSAYAELSKMIRQAGHDIAGQEIPERHWFYRMAKKKWFFGFGTYG